MSLTPSRIIKREYSRYGFASFFAYGPQGSGKTTYALKVLREVYGSWDEAIRHTYFHLEPLIADLKTAFQRRKRIPAVLIDDAGIALLKYRWQKESEQWFGKFYNLIRTVAASVIFTSVETEDIIKFVRNKVTYVVLIERGGNTHSSARGYRRYLAPTGEHYVRLEFVDHFALSLPYEIRENYEKMRRNAINRLFADSAAKPIQEADILQRAKELREEGLTWKKISEQIYSEFGIKRSLEWYRRRLQQISQNFNSKDSKNIDL